MRPTLCAVFLALQLCFTLVIWSLMSSSTATPCPPQIGQCSSEPHREKQMPPPPPPPTTTTTTTATTNGKGYCSEEMIQQAQKRILVEGGEWRTVLLDRVEPLLGCQTNSVQLQQVFFYFMGSVEETKAQFIRDHLLNRVPEMNYFIFSAASVDANHPLKASYTNPGETQNVGLRGLSWLMRTRNPSLLQSSFVVLVNPDAWVNIPRLLQTLSRLDQRLPLVLGWVWDSAGLTHVSDEVVVILSQAAGTMIVPKLYNQCTVDRIETAITRCAHRFGDIALVHTNLINPHPVMISSERDPEALEFYSRDAIALRTDSTDKFMTWSRRSNSEIHSNIF